MNQEWLQNAATRQILLEPIVLAGLQLRNRVVVAPMTRVSATADDVPTERMARYYAAFARGEFGLIITTFVQISFWD